MMVAAALMLPAQMRAGSGETVERLLQQYEQRPTAETANLFMQVLAEEQVVDEPVRFTPQMGADTMRQQVYYWAGEWLYGRQRYEAARDAALKALPHFRPGNPGRADCLNLLGIVYVRLADFSNAARYAKECLAIDMQSGDDDLISSSLNTVAAVYMAANQAGEAEKYITRALEYAGRTDNQARHAVILGMASEIYHKLGDDSKALHYAERAYSIDSLLQREPQATIRLSQKGYALIGLQRYGEAREVLGRVLPALKAVGDRHSYAIALNNMGTALLRDGQPRRAIPCYIEAAGILSQMGDLYNEIHSHRGLYESYWEINPDSAKLELDRFNLLKDSLYTHATAEALSRYNAEFGNERLQRENDEMRLQHRRTLMTGLLLLLLVVGAAWGAITYIRRRHQRRMRKLLAEIEKLRPKASAKASDGEGAPEAPAPAQEGAEPGESEAAEATDEEKEFLKRVIEAVNSAMADRHLGVEQIASALNMGEQSFRRRLQSAAGETPKAFFTAIRMQRAANLLTESPELPMARVAELCGFDNASSFGHAFRRMYDCSPSQYRDKAQGAPGR